MKIVALKERANHEVRAAISPETTKLFVKNGHKICVEKHIGIAANFADDDYIAAGAQVSAVPLEIVSDADIILKVQPSPITDKINELELAKPGAIIIGMFNTHTNSDYITKMLEQKLYGIAMERMPRITKAQNMDVLSSQSNVAGYRAVIEAAYHYNRIFPMIMSAAGTLAPAKVLILGVGVAGLQAIATAKRLGGVVSAYDVRYSVKEQVESLGAKFVSSDNAIVDMEDKSGYAKAGSDADKALQAEFLSKIIGNYDIVITTAQIPGKPAPRLISKTMIKSMTHGIIVDMATASGGNVEGSKLDDIVTIGGVNVVGISNLASKVPADSSKLYAKNLYNFLEYAIKDNKFDFEDEIVRQVLINKC